MERVFYDEKNGIYKGEFQLEEDISSKDIAWLGRLMADDSLSHPEMRLGYKNGGYHDILYTDHVKNIHVIDIEGTVSPDDLEEILAKKMPQGLSEGRKIRIAATGICPRTQRNERADAEHAMEMIIDALEHLYENAPSPDYSREQETVRSGLDY